MSGKFKVGDKVKILSGCSKNRIGLIEEVIEASRRRVYLYRVQHSLNKRERFYEKELELIGASNGQVSKTEKFKIGQKVVICYQSQREYFETDGVIVKVSHLGSWAWDVERFDGTIDGYHSDFLKTYDEFYNLGSGDNMISNGRTVTEPVLIDPRYCSCAEPVVVERFALGNSFDYCKICKKEHQNQSSETGIFTWENYWNQG